MNSARLLNLVMKNLIPVHPKYITIHFNTVLCNFKLHDFSFNIST